MKIIFAFLLLLALGASAQLLDTVLDTYQYSNYKALSSKSMLLLLWTPSETSIDFAVVGRMNFAGNEHCQKDGCWMGTGWQVYPNKNNIINIIVNSAFYCAVF